MWWFGVVRVTQSLKWRHSIERLRVHIISMMGLDVAYVYLSCTVLRYSEILVVRGDALGISPTSLASEN